MRADHELVHSLYGKQGSLWETQVDPATRDRIRAVVVTSGSAARLGSLDTTASVACKCRRVMVENAFMQFVDGNFAVVGQRQRDYLHDRVGDSFTARKPQQPSRSSAPLPTQLARLRDDFIQRAQQDMAAATPSLVDTSRDWYLLPTPEHLTPVVIQGKGDTYLVQGVDFMAFPGYIAVADNPAEIFASGLVLVCSAYLDLTTLESYSAAGQTDKWVSNYLKKSQSLEDFRRAAAEYAGLYVFDYDDVVLSTYETGGRSLADAVVRVYIMANAGAVTIRYPHAPLSVGQSIHSGYVICSRFEVVASSAYDSHDRKREAFMSRPASPILLDGIFPVKGLSWDGLDVEITHGGTGSGASAGKIHTRLMLNGSETALAKFWNLSKLHEQETGVFLHDALGNPALPSRVDFWTLLKNFYGGQLALIIADDHGESINSRLWRFVFEHHPRSCNILVSLNIGTSDPLTTGAYGEPLLRGDSYDLIPSVCETELLTINGDVWLLGGAPVTITTC